MSENPRCSLLRFAFLFISRLIYRRNTRCVSYATTIFGWIWRVGLEGSIASAFSVQPLCFPQDRAGRTVKSLRPGPALLCFCTMDLQPSALTHEQPTQIRPCSASQSVAASIRKMRSGRHGQFEVGRGGRGLGRKPGGRQKLNVHG